MTKEEKREYYREYLKEYNAKRRATKEYTEYQKQYHSSREYLDKLKKQRESAEYKEYQRTYMRPKNENNKILTKGIKNEDRITIAQYNALAKSQNNKCAICGQSETRKNKNGVIARLSIDHNHTTGKVRELLYGACNLILGNCRENVEVLKKTIAYISKWSCV